MIFYTENNYQNYGLSIIRRANTVRPYKTNRHIIQSEFQMNELQKIIIKLMSKQDGI